MDVLLLFAGSNGEALGVTQIAKELGLSKAVIHRILSSFRRKGFVEQDEASLRYRLGPNALYLGSSYIDRVDLRTIARPAIEELCAATNETSTLSIRNGFQRVYIDQVTPDQDVKMVVQLGKPWPLHSGASSKAFLAFMNEDEVSEYLGRTLEKLTPKTLTSPKALKRELEAIRDKGYASSAGERQVGAAAVAAPIFGAGGEPAAVMSVCGPVERFQKQSASAARLILAATKVLSDRLGFRG